MSQSAVQDIKIGVFVETCVSVSDRIRLSQYLEVAVERVVSSERVVF